MPKSHSVVCRGIHDQHSQGKEGKFVYLSQLGVPGFARRLLYYPPHSNPQRTSPLSPSLADSALLYLKPVYPLLKLIAANRFMSCKYRSESALTDPRCQLSFLGHLMIDNAATELSVFSSWQGLRSSVFANSSLLRLCSFWVMSTATKPQ